MSMAFIFINPHRERKHTHSHTHKGHNEQIESISSFAIITLYRTTWMRGYGICVHYIYALESQPNNLPPSQTSVFYQFIIISEGNVCNVEYSVSRASPVCVAPRIPRPREGDEHFNCSSARIRMLVRGAAYLLIDSDYERNTCARAGPPPHDHTTF